MTAEGSAEDDPQTIILGLSRQRNLGEIPCDAASAIGKPAGAIRLLNGYPGSGGWGFRHVRENPDRCKAIAGRGYDPLRLICAVASGWQRLHQSESERVIAVMPEQGYDLAVVVEWRNGFWSVTTALPYRAIKKPLLFQRARSDESEPRLAPAVRTRFETLTLPKRGYPPANKAS